ncbi:MAG TPA: MBL fold metallo-hydrolase [Povalibacter sp.]|nr:MBL fold metallo-hydrolase [Povalibacter sp.]
MRPIYQADLVNGAFGDPGVCIDLKFRNRALLFDIGDVSALPTRKLLRVSDVFVSHTHMDHFAGFDHLLRVCLGRDAGVTLYGPPHFIEQVGHKLHAYTWNLVENYSDDFVVAVHEVHPGCVQRARFRSRNRFQRESLPEEPLGDNILLHDDDFHVRTQAFDHHGLPSLAFSFEEHTHINVWRNRLEELGLPTGPWLTELKQRVRRGEPDDAIVEVRWRTREGSRREEIPLGVLREQVLEFVPGQRVCYVTDVAGHAANRDALVAFLHDADIAFIEAVFLAQDAEHAARKAHLTAGQAGGIARAAGVRTAVPFHFSTRYFADEQPLRREFEAALSGRSVVGDASRS